MDGWMDGCMDGWMDMDGYGWHLVWSVGRIAQRAVWSESEARLGAVAADVARMQRTVQAAQARQQRVRACCFDTKLIFFARSVLGFCVSVRTFNGCFFA